MHFKNLIKSCDDNIIMKNKHAEHLFTKNVYLCFIERKVNATVSKL